MQVRESRSCLLCRSRPCLVRPTGTPAIESRREPKRREIAQAAIHSSPSLTPGQSTSWAWKSMPARSSRSRSSMICAPFGLPTRATRSSGLVAWTETCIGRDPLLLDPAPVVLGQVGQRDEAAVEHRVAVVVVHDVERPAHALRNLLDEAEWAGVLADADAIEGRIGERDAPEFVALAARGRSGAARRPARSRA